MAFSSLIQRLRKALSALSALAAADTRAPHIQTGAWGEQQAARYLKRQGYKLLGRNVRFNKREELDIVMRDAKTLIFVEVKTRTSPSTRPADAVNKSKRTSLRRAAKSYMARLENRRHLVYRFDIVEVVGSPAAKEAPVIRHLKHAFHIGDHD